MNPLTYESDCIILEFDQKNQIQLLLKQINRRKIPYFIAFSNIRSTDYEEIRDELNSFFWGVIDLEHPPIFYQSLLNSMKIFSQQKAQHIKHLEKIQSMSEQIGQVNQELSKELKKLKILQNKLIPIRKKRYRNIIISSKYLPGIDIGGEYFDIIKNKKKSFLFLLTNCKTYKLSSLVISYVSKLKRLEHINHKTLEKLFQDLISGDLERYWPGPIRPDHFPIEILAFIIDLNSLKMDGLNLGQTMILNEDGPIEQLSSDLGHYSMPFVPKYFNYQLKRGEKLAILSPGLQKNCQGLIDELSLVTFFQNHYAMGPSDFIREVNYHLRKQTPEQLKNDSTIIMIEVGQNAIFQAI